MRKADPELRAQRERQIIDAAVSCFVETGFHQTSMQHVAAASGLSIGLIYRYFENKEAIISRVAQLDREATIGAVEALPDHGDPAAIWAGWLNAAVAEWSEPGTARLVNEVYAEAARNAGLQATLRKSELQLTEAIVQKLERQADAGILASALDTEAVGEGILMLFDGAVSRRFASARLSQETLDRVIHKLAAGLFRAI